MTASSVLGPLKFRLLRSQLDRRLAEGEDPVTSAELARRAFQILSPSSRRRLATALRARVDEAERPRVALSSAIPVCGEAVRPLAPVLLMLADELESAELVLPRGVALIRLLLLDGGSPLYGSRDDGALEHVVEQARQSLRQYALH